MIALVAFGNKKVSLEEVEKPCLTNNNQALIKVKGSGICGSDHIFFDDKVTLDWVKYPVIVGHEFAGIIEKIGDDKKGLEVGDHVVIDNYLRCGKCIYCKTGRYFLCDYHAELGQTINGGFAEYCVVPITNLVKIPSNMDFKHAAIIENVATALRACRRANIRFGQKVVIIGAGTLGVLIGLISKTMGADVTIVSRGARLTRIEQLNFCKVINSTNQDWKSIILKDTDNAGAEVVFEASGSIEPLLKASQIINKTGKLFLLGVTGGKIGSIALDKIVLNEIEIIGSVSGMGYFEEAVKLVENKIINLDQIISHTFNLAEVLEAFRYESERIEGAIKIVILQ